MIIKITLFIQMSSSTTKSPSGAVVVVVVGFISAQCDSSVTIMRAEAARCSPIKTGLGGCGQPLITPPGINCTASWGDSGGGGDHGRVAGEAAPLTSSRSGAAATRCRGPAVKRSLPLGGRGAQLSRSSPLASRGGATRHPGGPQKASRRLLFS